MGKFCKADLLLAADLFKREDAEVREEINSETTKVPSGETVRLYVTFNEGYKDSLTAQMQAEELLGVLPTGAHFEIKRVDDTGYAAVIETEETYIDFIKKSDKVSDVTIEEQAETTGDVGALKKNEAEGLVGSETENISESVDESITVNTNENELGNLETIAVMDTVPDTTDKGVGDKGGLSVLLPIALMAFIVGGVAVFKLLKKKK
jgi:hypothetical protein